MVERELPKLRMRVRFPLLAPSDCIKSIMLVMFPLMCQGYILRSKITAQPLFLWFGNVFYRIKMINEQYKLLGRKVANLRQKDDFYPTPAYVTQALLDNYRFTGEIWEPACGDGRMSKILEQYYSKVESSDLINRGYGTAGVDFLASSREVDNIITNPPFNLAFEFIVQGLRLSRRCLALLLPIRYLTGKRRAKLYHEFPPAKVIVIPNKVDFLGFGSPAMEFAWFVWEKGVSQTTIVWADVKDAELAKKTKRRKNA